MSEADEILARVEALCVEWEAAAKKPRPERGPGESAQDDGVRIGVWHSVRTAAAELRAALLPTRPDCHCATPNRPTGREPEQLPPWECLTCGGYACEYADPGQTRCSPAICDCFIASFPESPRDLHPEAFVVAAATQEAPEAGAGGCSCGGVGSGCHCERENTTAASGTTS